MEFWSKVALLAGLFMIVTPAVLRMNDVIDNSIFSAIFVVGILLVIVANNNWTRRDEQLRD
jgi:uncharacterized membrane protein YidH (DUF202 family)